MTTDHPDSRETGQQKAAADFAANVFALNPCDAVNGPGRRALTEAQLALLFTQFATRLHRETESRETGQQHTPSAGALGDYFFRLRQDPAHHLGCGDIRLTLAQQVDLAVAVDRWLHDKQAAAIARAEGRMP